MAEYNLSASSSWNGTILRDCCVGWMEGDERSLIYRLYRSWLNKGIFFLFVLFFTTRSCFDKTQLTGITCVSFTNASDPDN